MQAGELMGPRTEGIENVADLSRWLKYLVVALIILVAVITRLSSPWRMDVTNDEMLHLESYRLHYRTDNISPEFLLQLDRRAILAPWEMGLFRKLYSASPLVQRALIVVLDLHPPLHPVMAEIIEALSASNLVALRIPSLLASFACILLMYLLGSELKNGTLGLWLAALTTVSLTAQAYAGIGRPYALAQALTAATILAFVSLESNFSPRLRSFLLLALIAQTSDWMVWPCVGPLVLAACVRHYSGGVKIRELIKETWWYALISLLLLAYLMLQLRAPSLLTEFSSRHTAIDFWRSFAVASPFAALRSIGRLPSNIGTAAFVITIAIGIADLLLWSDQSPTIRYGFLTVLLAYVAMALVTWEFRLSTIFIVPLIALSGLGIVHLLPAKAAYCEASLVAFLTAFLILAVYAPQDYYATVFTQDGPYSAMAAKLSAELKNGDIWVSYPYFRADCLYRYGLFPQPIRPRTDQEMLSFWRARPAHRTCFIFTSPSPRDPVFLMIEKNADREWRFSNGFRILRLRARLEVDR